jgi:hypothetical protein
LAATSPSEANSDVEPTMSVNRIVRNADIAHGVPGSGSTIAPRKDVTARGSTSKIRCGICP